MNTKVTETSKEAYLRIPMQPQHQKLLIFFKYHYPLRFSDQDIVRRFRWKINIVTARRNALMQSGYIKHAGYQKNPETGFRNRIYQYVKNGVKNTP